MVSIERLRQLSKYKYLYLLFVPVVAWYLIFAYAPMYGLVMAFQDYSMSKGYFHSDFVGLKNFIDLFNDGYFLRALRNTVIIAGYRLLIEFPFPILLALLFNEVRHIGFRKAIQTIVYLPHFLSWVIVASVFITFLNPERGVVAAAFTFFNMDVPDLLTNPGVFRRVLVLTDIWKEAGFSTVIYVAAMAGVDCQQYEAATVDGAGRLSQIWHVTLPGIKNVVIIMFILMLGQILGWGFDQVYNFYNPVVYSTGDIVDTYIFRTALGDNKFSYAAAAGMVRSVVCAVMLYVSNRIVKAIGEESIY